MKIFTIGFTKKNAKKFFSVLKENDVRVIIDIRLNNSSQLAGFSKGDDLEFFLKELYGIAYFHDISLAPTKEILDNYKKGKIDWDQYEVLFGNLLKNRDIKKWLDDKYDRRFEHVCLLCSEETANKCHRRLVAELIKNVYPELDIEIKHI